MSVQPMSVAEGSMAEEPSLAPAIEKRLETMRRRMLHPILFRFFLLTKLPLALMAGLRVRSLDRRRCEVSVPYGWRSTNPFRSTYFAAQAMAAEMSTGALGLMAASATEASVATLIVNSEATFLKKATKLATFTCEAGDDFFAAVQRAVSTGEPQTCTAESVGRMPDGTVVSRFTFTWSFKKRG